MANVVRLVIACLFALTLSACGGDDPDSDGASGNESTPSGETSPDGQDEEPAGGEVTLPDPCLLSAADLAEFVGNEVDEGVAGKNNLGWDTCDYAFAGVQGTNGFVAVHADDPADPQNDQWDRTPGDEIDGFGDRARYEADQLVVLDGDIVYSFGFGELASMQGLAEAYLAAAG